MALLLHDTRRARKEAFAPAGEPVRMYVCGPTVYGDAHMGHARSYVVFDVLRRYLEYRGHRVLHVQNYTDLEDSITKRAAELGEDPLAYAEAKIAAFRRDMDRLGVRAAHHYPRVTEHIPEIVATVRSLLAKGFAYERGGSVYFRARKAGALGSLSHRDIAEAAAGMEAGERDDPLDFGVWKRAKPGEPAWDSPWGRGRPGWHVECYAMGSKYLGTQVDLHGGGRDLIYPHHESEEMIAEAATGPPWARHWMHNGFLLLQNEKMSKSLGNSVPLAPLLEEHGPDVLRFCLIREHYRDNVEHDPVCFGLSRDAVARIREARAAADGLGGGRGGEKALRLVEHSRARFAQAMDDDLDTTNACLAVVEFAEAVVELRDVGGAEARAVREAFDGFLSVLGLFGR